MKELMLKYGCNPHQKPAKIFTEEKELPFQILNGNPSYINLLDALNGWQLVKELKEATGIAAAASFKHVSPAGAAIGIPLNDILRKQYFVQEDNLSDIAAAYIRARGADRMSSYGDFVALSEECDLPTAIYLSQEFSDGIIVPSYSAEALNILTNKKKGNYLIMQMDSSYIPKDIETKEVYGIAFEQQRNNCKITTKLFTEIPTQNKIIPEDAKRDLLISLITLKYTQSNSVCYVKDGQAIGIGAGQQSRIHCTRLAGNIADVWSLRQNPKVLALPFRQELKRAERDNAIDLYITGDALELLSEGIWEEYFIEKPEPLNKEEKLDWLKGLSGVALGSDAYFPFGDNIDRAAKSGVRYIAQPGGSIRDAQVIDACNQYNMAMAFTGVRLFHH